MSLCRFPNSGSHIFGYPAFGGKKEKDSPLHYTDMTQKQVSQHQVHCMMEAFPISVPISSCLLGCKKMPALSHFCCSCIQGASIRGYINHDMVQQSINLEEGKEIYSMKQVAYYIAVTQSTNIFVLTIQIQMLLNCNRKNISTRHSYCLVSDRSEKNQTLIFFNI